LFYCPFQNIVRPTAFGITQERNELETCGFHQSIEALRGHKSMNNPRTDLVLKVLQFLNL
jgi:hypothetical protein